VYRFSLIQSKNRQSPLATGEAGKGQASLGCQHSHELAAEVGRTPCFPAHSGRQICSTWNVTQEHAVTVVGSPHSRTAG
jgi:hypothetical protein